MSKIGYLIAGAMAMTAGIATAQTPQAQTLQQSQMPGMSSTGAASPQAATPAPSQPAAAAAGKVQAVSAADIKAGAPVLDTQGGSVGTIESVNGDNAVLSTGKVRVQLAVASFGKNDKGLVISMTKAQVEAEAAKAGGTGG